MRQWTLMVVRLLFQLVEMLETLVKAVGLVQEVLCLLGMARMVPLQLRLQPERRPFHQCRPSISMSMSHRPIHQQCRTGVTDAMTLSTSTVPSSWL